MSEPTGREHITPVEITMTSATERAAFRKCRRQWFLTTVHHLETMETNLNFWMGELVHSGLETYYKAQQGGLPHEERVALAQAAYEDAYEAAIEPIKEELGENLVWPLAEPMYEDLGAMGYQMLENYYERETVHPIGDEVVQVEQRLFVPIMHEGKEIGKLAVRTDLFVRRFGSLAAVDHKTAGHRLGSAALDIDDQLSAEVYAGWHALGEFPEQAIYNALLKRVPGPPRQIKGTKAEPIKLSKDKDQPTTFALYLAEINRLGLDRDNYEDILNTLDDREMRDVTPFFYREETFRTPGQMDQFERNLAFEFLDMVEVGAHPEKAYPNPGFACQTCPVARVCATIMDGGDPEHLITTQFTVGKPRY